MIVVCFAASPYSPFIFFPVLLSSCTGLVILTMRPTAQRRPPLHALRWKYPPHISLLRLAHGKAPFLPPPPPRASCQLVVSLGAVGPEVGGAFGSQERTAFEELALPGINAALGGPSCFGHIKEVGKPGQPRYGIMYAFKPTEAGRARRQRLADNGQVTFLCGPTRITAPVHTVAAVVSFGTRVVVSGLQFELSVPGVVSALLSCAGYSRLVVGQQSGGELPARLVPLFPPGTAQSGHLVAEVTPPPGDPTLSLLPREFLCGGAKVTVSVVGPGFHPPPRAAVGWAPSTRAEAAGGRAGETPSAGGSGGARAQANAAVAGENGARSRRVRDASNGVGDTQMGEGNGDAAPVWGGSGDGEQVAGRGRSRSRSHFDSVTHLERQGWARGGSLRPGGRESSSHLQEPLDAVGDLGGRVPHDRLGVGGIPRGSRNLPSEPTLALGERSITPPPQRHSRSALPDPKRPRVGGQERGQERARKRSAGASGGQPGGRAVGAQVVSQRTGRGKPSPGDPVGAAIMLWLEDEAPEATRAERQAAADRLRIKHAKVWMKSAGATRPGDLPTELKNLVLGLLPRQVLPVDLPPHPTSGSSSMGDAEVDDLLQEAAGAQPPAPPPAPDPDIPMPPAGPLPA